MIGRQDPPLSAFRCAVSFQRSPIDNIFFDDWDRLNIRA